MPKATKNCSSSQTPDQCVAHQTRATCPEGLNYCVRSRFTNASIDIEKRSCATLKTCGSLNVSCEQHKKARGGNVTCDWSCCQKDLCNAGVYPIAQCLMPVMTACVLYAFLGPYDFRWANLRAWCLGMRKSVCALLFILLGGHSSWHYTQRAVEVWTEKICILKYAKPYILLAMLRFYAWII